MSPLLFLIFIYWVFSLFLGFPGSGAGKEPGLQRRRPRFDSCIGRYRGEVIGYPLQYSPASRVAQLVKKILLQCRRPGFDPWVRKIPWRRAWQPTPVFLPGESPWTKQLTGLQSMGSQRVRHNWATRHSTALYLIYFCSNLCHFLNGGLSFPFFSRFFRCKAGLFIEMIFKMYTFITVNFPLRTAFTASYTFCIFCFYLWLS